MFHCKCSNSVFGRCLGNGSSDTSYYLWSLCHKVIGVWKVVALRSTCLYSVGLLAGDSLGHSSFMTKPLLSIIIVSLFLY